MIAMTASAAGQPAPSAGAGQAGRVRNLRRRLTRWWFQPPGGGTYQRRRADALVAAAGLGVVVACGVLVANRTLVSTDVALFRRINHWPGWLYPPMWTVQLSGVIGALPLVAAAAALLRRLRLAAALAAAILLKVSLEAAAKTVVQRDRPAQTLHDVILRGKAAAHGLSFPSGHSMVIFAIATLVAPYFKGWWKGPAVGPGRRGVPVPGLPRRALPVGRHRGGGSWYVHRERAEPRIRRTGQQLQPADDGEFACTARRDLVNAAFLSICPDPHLLQSDSPEQPHDATH
jgi:hypothetical protein